MIQRAARCVYVLLEESPQQLIRNMRTIGLNLAQWTQRGLLQLQAARPSRCGLEAHLATLYRTVDEIRPESVVVDCITDLLSLGGQAEVEAMLVRRSSWRRPP